MPGLWWESQPYSLSPPYPDIVAVYAAIAKNLPDFTDIVQSGTDIHATYAPNLHYFLVITYQHVAAQNYIRMAMLAFDDGFADPGSFLFANVLNTLNNILHV
jgi:hypothetical protein